MSKQCPRCERHHSLELITSHPTEDGLKCWYECRDCNWEFAEIKLISKPSSQEEFFIKPDLFWEKTSPSGKELKAKPDEELDREALAKSLEDYMKVQDFWS